MNQWNFTNDAVIKVIGVGGGGGNAVEHMVRERIEGVEFFAVNTDAQALRKTAVGQTIQIGSGITKGLGAGANPEVTAMRLMRIAMHCVRRWKVQTWSLYCCGYGWWYRYRCSTSRR